MIFHFIRIALGLLFVFSGVLKMTDLISFHDTIEQFDIIPLNTIDAATIFIPAVEMICGLFLLLNIFKKGAIAILTPLMFVFIIGIAVNLYRGVIFDCGCFGPLQIFSSISIYSILFNISLIGLLGLSFFKDRVEVDIQKHFEVIMTYSMFFALVLYVPYSSTKLEYEINYRNVEKINWEQAYELMENENAFLIDARPNDRYEREHVPEAISIPFDSFAEYYKKISIDKSATVLVYCDGLDCTASQRVANKIVQRGFLNVYNITSGWDGWKKIQ